jgi:hypothetical protein
MLKMAKHIRTEISIHDRGALLRMENGSSEATPETMFVSVHRQFSRKQELSVTTFHAKLEWNSPEMGLSNWEHLRRLGV